MVPSFEPDPTQPEPTGYIIAIIGQLKILISQQEIYTLEPVIDINRSTRTAQGSIGHIVVDEESWPVYCISEELKPLQQVPDTRRICILLNIPNGFIGILCDQVILTEWSNPIDILPIPICMQTPNTALQGLIIQEDEVLCVTASTDLLAYCEALS